MILFLSRDYNYTITTIKTVDRMMYISSSAELSKVNRADILPYTREFSSDGAFLPVYYLLILEQDNT